MGGHVSHGDSAEKLRRLQAVTDAALSQLGLEDLLDELLERVRELLQVDTAAVLLVDPSGEDLVATAASGLGQHVRQGMRLPVGRGFAGTVAASGQPLTIDQVDHNNLAGLTVLARNVTSVLGVPMISSGRVIGVLQVGTVALRHFTDDDTELLQLVADRASLATQARLSRLDRAAALALQRSLLPARPRTVEGLDVAARYVPGADVGVGGDWYDLFPLPSGHIGIAIGDVAGSGLHAAVVMGRIRSALRAYALETTDPAEVLTRLDRKVQLFEPNAMATAIYAVLDPTHANLALSSAGHLPPVLAADDAPTRTVEIVTDLPLGAYHNTDRHNIHLTFPPGGCLLLYTDGLVERRHRPISAGIAVLLTAVTCAPADTVCTNAMTALLDNHPATDDVAVLAVRRSSHTTPDTDPSPAPPV